MAVHLVCSDDGCALGVLLGSDDDCALGVLLTTPWLQSCGLVTSLVLSEPKLTEYFFFF